MVPLPHLLLLAAAQGDLVDLSSVRLEVVVVRDPELHPIEPELVKKALEHAKEEFVVRFGARAPTFDVVDELSLTGFLGAYALPRDPTCKPLYAARYRGGGEPELGRRREQALEFFRRWDLDALRGFIAEADRGRINSYDDIYDYYAAHYSRTVEAMKGLTTPEGTPLVEPGRSAKRSFAAWTCALERQRDFDVVITNAFILADLMDEPHPHAVFGKAKVGGIAAPSPGRSALGGQALLATTFGIDTRISQFREVEGKRPTFEERAKILGAYLLAHEIAHAVFGIPDVFDHPPGCLMTSRPGATYRDGLVELEANARPCPRCRPYVVTRNLVDQGRRRLDAGHYSGAMKLFTRALKTLPKHVHGGRKRRVSQILVLAAQAARGQGLTRRARKYALLAMKLDPSSEAASALWQSMAEAPTSRPLPASRRTSTTSTTWKGTP